MPSGTPISAEQQDAIIIDAAKGDFKAAAELHQVSLTTVYRIVGEYRPYYEKLCESYAVQGKINTYVIGVRAQRELIRRMDEVDEGGVSVFEDPSVFKTGTIIGLWETTMKVQEKYSRMDGQVKARDVVLAGLRARDPQIIRYVKEILWSIPEEELNDILNDDESGNNPKVQGEGPG